MIIMRRLTVVLLLAVLAVSILSCGESETEKSAGDRIPVEVIFGIGERINPLLSPDGEQLAYLALSNGTMNVHVSSIDDPANGTPVTFDSMYGIRRFVWSGDSRRILYLRDSVGSGSVHLYDVEISSGTARDLTPFDYVRAQIVAVDNDIPNNILFALNLDNPRAYNVYNLNLTTGDFDLAVENPGNVIGWLADNNLQIKGCLQVNDNGTYEFMVADDKTNTWQEVISWNSVDMMDSSPIRFSGDNKYAFVLDARDANTGRLTKVDLSSGETEVLAEDSIYNVKGAIFNPVTHELEAVSFDGQREFTEAVDETFDEHLAAFEKLNDGDFFISSRSKDNSKWLIGFKQDDAPVPFYIYDRATRQATLLFEHYPELGQYQLAKMEPVSFEARDGLTIHGYLSFPPDVAHENLPMVVLVHDGPWLRDSWGYRPEVQWFTSLGYACLQVNFRGSTGYGKKFRQAGIRQWGAAMQDDIIDGVRWAVDKNYADPDRIAIVGEGYGGYAALMATIQDGNMFAAAIDISGYTSVPALMESIPDYNTHTRLLYYNRVGNLDMEREFLESISPNRYFDKIETPLLVVHGAMDPKVPSEDVNALTTSLEERDVPHEILLLDNEGHGLAQTSNRLLYYQTAEQFLATHVKYNEKAENNITMK